jgi:ParB family chromosome partitioning protein
MSVILEPMLPARTIIDQAAVHELAKTIKTNGQQQPIKVVPRDDRFEIVFGHRRFLAIRHLGQPTILAIVAAMSQAQLWTARLTENLARESMSPFDEAVSLQHFQKETKLNGTSIAKALGKSPAWVSQRLAIMEYPDILIDALQHRKITFSVARLLSQVENQTYLRFHLSAAIENGATPAVVERWVADLRHQADNQPPQSDAPDPDVNPEHMLGPRYRCYFCDKEAKLTDMKNIWVENRCLKAAIETIIQASEKAASEG